MSRSTTSAGFGSRRIRATTSSAPDSTSAASIATTRPFRACRYAWDSSVNRPVPGSPMTRTASSSRSALSAVTHAARHAGQPLSGRATFRRPPACRDGVLTSASSVTSPTIPATAPPTVTVEPRMRTWLPLGRSTTSSTVERRSITKRAYSCRATRSPGSSRLCIGEFAITVRSPTANTASLLRASRRV